MRYLMIVFALVSVLGISRALAEDKKPVPPAPPPSSKCAAAKLKTSCRNEEAIRQLLLAAPPGDHTDLPNRTISSEDEKLRK